MTPTMVRAMYRPVLSAARADRRLRATGPLLRLTTCSVATTPTPYRVIRLLICRLISDRMIKMTSNTVAIADPYPKWSRWKAS